MARKSIHERIFSKSPAERTVGEVALTTGDFSLLPEFAEGGQLPNVVLPAAKEKYRTVLTGSEKPQFENWRKQLPKNLQYDRDYDLQGLWKENPNVKPTENLHFTDKYKRPNHPTFSNESQYFNLRTKQTAGHWQETPKEWDYIPYDESIKQPIVEKKFAEGGDVTPRKVTTVPTGYDPIPNRPNYYKKASNVELSVAAGGGHGGADYESYLQKQLAAGVSPEELVNKKYIGSNSVEQYRKFYKPLEDIVYTEQAPVINDKPAVAQRGQAVYGPNKHITGEIFYPSRNSPNQQSGGTLSTDVQPAHFKFRNDFGYTGEEVDLDGSDIQKYLGTTHTFGNEDLIKELKGKSTKTTVAKMEKGGTVLNGEGFDGDAAMMAGANALPGIMSAFDPNATAATKGSGIGSGIGGIAGTIVGGPIGGMIGSTLGGVVGGMIGGHPEEKLRQKRYSETANHHYNKLDVSYNADPYGQNTSFYAEDGGQAPGQQPAAPTPVNIEKGELAVDPSSFEVIRKFDNKNRYASHAKTSFQEPVGNHVGLPEGTIIIPKKDAKTYEKGSKLTRRSILANLLKDQANREHAEGMDKKMADGGGIDEIVDPPAVTVTAYRNKKRLINPASITGIHNPLQSELPNDGEAYITGVHNPLVSNLPNGPEPVEKPGFKMPHISGVAASQALGLAPTIYGMANAFGSDPYLQYDDNADGFARGEAYLQQTPTDVNIEPAKAAMTRTARGYEQQLNNVNSPSIRAENASNFTKVINATGELYANADNERKNRIASKLGQLANLKVQQGADGEQARNRYATELRMDKANREGLIQKGLSEASTNISKGVMDRERIKSLNAMAKYFKLDPTGKQLISENPDAVQHIVDQLEGGFMPNFAVPETKGKTSTTTQRDARGRVKQTSQTVKG